MTNIYIILCNIQNPCYKLKSNIFNKLQDKYTKFNYKIVYEIPNDSNSIIYILKRKINIKILKELKDKNNYLIYEPLDQDWNSYKNIEEYVKNNLDYFNLFDEIICNNKYMMDKIKHLEFNKKLSVNYHEYDEKYKSNNIINKSILYIGRLDKTSLSILDMKNNNITNIENFNDIYKDKCIHIDFLINNNLYYTLHTSTKLSTAMYLKCIFICNKIPVYVELLGEDYEFYLNDDLSNIQMILNNAQKTINNTDNYNAYITKYEYVKNILSPENICNNYHKIFTNNIKKNKDIFKDSSTDNKIQNKIINNKNMIFLNKLINKKK